MKSIESRGIVRTPLLIAPFLIVALLAISSCGGDKKTETQTGDSATKKVATEVQPSPGPSGSPLDGSQVASLSVYDTDGQLRKLDEWIGKQPVVINFWGTWCPPCRREIPELVKLYDEYKTQGVEIVSFALRDTPQKVEAYTSQAGMKWVMLMGDQNIAARYRVSGVPTTFFYDKDGKLAQVKDSNGRLVDRFVGPRSYETFKTAFESIL